VGGLRVGLVVLVRFPFSDLSSSKLRPALVVAHAGGTDWILCQITSNPYNDPRVVWLEKASFGQGGLSRDSFVRPGKVFTASESIVVRAVGQLTVLAHGLVIDALVRLLQGSRSRVV
jgi:mRNA interferase MazF